MVINEHSVLCIAYRTQVSPVVLPSLSLRILNVGSENMTFGGLRSIEALLVHPGQVRTHDFVGCVRNIHVNGRALTPAMALRAHNILQK